MKYKKMIRSNHRLLTNGFFVESYRYDALGRRTATVNAEGTERHVWDGDHCLADVDEEGNALRAYLWGEGVDRLLAVRIGPRTYAALADAQGTVWGFADAAGRIAARWMYDAWGNVLSEEIAESAEALRFVRYRFQGREFSLATGLTNFRARWYDPAIGRWLSKDPIGLSGGLNLYVFCENNTVNRIDPAGFAHTATRPLRAKSKLGQTLSDAVYWIPMPGNLRPLHEGIIFEDGKDSEECPAIVGFFDKTGVQGDKQPSPPYRNSDDIYNDEIMRQAVKNLKDSGLWGGEDYGLISHNCQDFVSAAINEYNRLSSSQKGKNKSNKPRNHMFPQQWRNR